VLPRDDALVRDLGRVLAPERVLSRPIDLLGRSETQKQIGQRKARGVIHALLFRTSLTEIHLLGFTFNHLGQVDRSYVLFANVAEHTLQYISLSTGESTNQISALKRR